MGGFSAKRSSDSSAFSSVKGILEEVGKQFHKPDVIDERMRQDFIEEVMPNAPPLTEQEKGMFESLGGLEEELAKEGKRVKGSVRGVVDKFLWTEGDNIWGAFSCKVDISVWRMWDYLYNLNTYESAQDHKNR
jgi:hypothetical protein